MSRLPGGVWGAKRWAAALCILLPWAPACGGSGALTNASSNANSVGPSVDPASLSTPAKEIQVVSMANRNTCLRPQTGALAAAQDAVGTALCTGDANDSWRLDAKGTLSFGGTLCLVASASQAGLELAPCSDDPSQNITLFSGRLLLGASGSNQQAVAAADAAATRSDFTAAVVAAPSSTDGDPSQKWQIGLARPGLSGDANIYVSGFVMTLSASPTMCLTGRGITVGVAACNGSASQLWIINETGGVQLGAYCLSATTPGTISQGTPSQFALCRADDAGQRWLINRGVVGLQTWFLSPTTVPPAAAGYTPTALSTAQVVWLLGG